MVAVVVMAVMEVATRLTEEEEAEVLAEELLMRNWDHFPSTNRNGRGNLVFIYI